MIMHTEMQMRALHRIKPEHRMWEIDATGSLIKIPRYMRAFNQILNYAMLVKNINALDIHVIQISKMASSRHDTCAIGEFFNKLLMILN